MQDCSAGILNHAGMKFSEKVRLYTAPWYAALDPMALKQFSYLFIYLSAPHPPRLLGGKYKKMTLKLHFLAENSLQVKFLQHEMCHVQYALESGMVGKRGWGVCVGWGEWGE